MAADKRIVYGATCVWWDSIDKVATKRVGESPHELPCCPHCGGVLMEVPSIENWNASAERYEKQANWPGYVAMMNWSRGKCFPNMLAMKDAYEAHLEKAKLQ